MSRPALLDVNLLVALFDPDHIHHEIAHDWFADHHEDGWATCPLTENGFVRVLSNPAYGGVLRRPTELMERLRRFCASRHHHFWPASVSFLDAKRFKPALVRGHRQVTDIYLLGLAVEMHGCLATLDGAMSLNAVARATREHLCVVAAVARD